MTIARQDHVRLEDKRASDEEVPFFEDVESRYKSIKARRMDAYDLCKNILALIGILSFGAIAVYGVSLKRQGPNASQFETLEDLRRIHGSTPGESRVKVSMVVREPTRGFCQSLFGQIASGFDAPHLLNFRQDFPHRFGEKILRAKEYLESSYANDHDVYLFIDGSDVLFQMPEREFYRRFNQANKAVLYSAEKYCYPFEPNATVCRNMPESTLPKDTYGVLTDIKAADLLYHNVRPRFLNSGAIIGRRNDLHVVYDIAAKVVLSEHGSSDQRIHQTIFSQEAQVNKTSLALGLDYRSSLFQSMVASQWDIAWEVNPNGQSLSNGPAAQARKLKLDVSGLGLDEDDTQRSSFWYGRPLARNKATNTLPGLLHHNGNKEWMDAWWPNYWYNQGKTRKKMERIVKTQVRPGEAGAWDGDVWRPWSELCGAISLDP